MNKSKRIVYFEIDNVLVNFKSGIEKPTKQELDAYEGRFDKVPRIFSKMLPNDGAVEAYQTNN